MIGAAMSRPLSAPQAIREARALLLETLDWIGLVNISASEEERAEELQERINDFVLRSLAAGVELIDPATCAPPPTPADHHERVMQARLRVEMADREKRLAQQLLQSVMRNGDGEQKLYAVRRNTLAYERWQQADRDAQDAETEYYRSLTRQEVPRCDAA